MVAENANTTPLFIESMALVNSKKVAESLICLATAPSHSRQRMWICQQLDKSIQYKGKYVRMCDNSLQAPRLLLRSQ